MESADMQKLTI